MPMQKENDKSKNYFSIIENTILKLKDKKEETTIKRNLNRGKTSNRPDDANEEFIKKRRKIF